MCCIKIRLVTLFVYLYKHKQYRPGCTRKETPPGDTEKLCVCKPPERRDGRTILQRQAIDSKQEDNTMLCAGETANFI